MTTITPQHHVLGWKRDLPDHRDFMYAAPDTVLRSLPSAVDLRSTMPPVYDQGEIGSCTANSIAGAVQFIRSKQAHLPDFVPSRLFIYYNERNLERTIPLDAGASLRDGIRTVATFGVCPETEWPYLPVAADPATNVFPPGSPPVTQPSATCYSSASLHTAIQYARVQQSFSQLRGCLAQGYPFVFGFTVYSNIYDQNGEPVVNLTMPSSNDQMLGGHAVLAVGYDDSTRMFTIRNSWGAATQDHGYFYMPYGYLTDQNLSSDVWTIRRESA